MSEEDKKEEKLEFTAEGEAFAYISLDQARVRAIEQARDNRDFYGSTYSQGDLVWEVVRQEESEDYYDIRLSYRPASGFVGKPGIEQFTIDKTGPITLRQILSHPKPSTRTKTILAGLGLVVLIGAIAGGLAAAGVFSSSSGSELVIDPTESVAVFVAPDVAAQLLSPQGDVTIDIEAGTFGSTSQLTYEPFSIGTCLRWQENTVPPARYST